MGDLEAPAGRVRVRIRRILVMRERKAGTQLSVASDYLRQPVSTVFGVTDLISDHYG